MTPDRRRGRAERAEHAAGDRAVDVADPARERRELLGGEPAELARLGLGLASSLQSLPRRCDDRAGRDEPPVRLGDPTSLKTRLRPRLRDGGVAPSGPGRGRPTCSSRSGRRSSRRATPAPRRRPTHAAIPAVSIRVAIAPPWTTSSTSRARAGTGARASPRRSRSTRARIPRWPTSGELRDELLDDLAPLHAPLDCAQMLMPASTACLSISASSSSVNARLSSAATLVSSCSTLDAPISARRDARVAQDPRDRHLRERLPAALRDLVERLDARHVLLVDEVVLEEVVLGRARVLGDAAEVAVGEHALAERREGDDADALLAARVQHLGLDPAVQQRVRRLVDEDRRAERAGDLDRLLRALGGVGADAGVERLARSGPRCRARRSSPPAACRGRSGASRRCRRTPGPCGPGSGRGSRAGTCASPTRRTGRATCRSRPWSR